MTAPEMTAAEIVDALRAGFGIADADIGSEQWVMLTEVPLALPRGTQEPDPWTTGIGIRRIDAMLVGSWAGAPTRRMAVEIKVSAADYRAETDAKRGPAYAACHRATYCAPAGVIDPQTLPRGWGLIEVWPSRQVAEAAGEHPFGIVGDGPVLCWRVSPTDHEPRVDADMLIATLARQAGRYRERLHRGADTAATIAVYAAQAASDGAKVARAQETVHRERTRAKAALSQMLAVQGMQVCSACHYPIRFVVTKAPFVWVHDEARQHDRCAGLRAGEGARRRAAATGAAYVNTVPPPIVPQAVVDVLGADDVTVTAPRR